MSSPPHNGVSVFTQPAASLRRFALNSGLVAAGASAVPEPHAAKAEDAEADEQQELHSTHSTSTAPVRASLTPGLTLGRRRIPREEKHKR